jgi:hypothetical protein
MVLLFMTGQKMIEVNSELLHLKLGKLGSQNPQRLLNL